MGFIDLVGIATNNVKLAFMPCGRLANLQPMTLFLWFTKLSESTGLLVIPCHYAERRLIPYILV